MPINGENMPSVKLPAQPASSPIQDETESLALLAKALSHPARVGIVRLLHEKQTCIGCDIVDEIGLAQSTTSEHLRILKSAGVITGEIERPRVCYSLNPAALEPLSHFLEEVAGAQPAQTKN
jgi:ArsR family transcriptional regulator